MAEHQGGYDFTYVNIHAYIMDMCVYIYRDTHEITCTEAYTLQYMCVRNPQPYAATLWKTPVGQ